MATKHKIARIAQEKGISEAELLTLLINQHPEQKDIAEKLGVSQSSVSVALRRHGFMRIVTWKKKRGA